MRGLRRERCDDKPACIDGLHRQPLHSKEAPLERNGMRQPARWICAQLGSREHYAIPRALQSEGRLEWLLTDFWASPRWLWRAAAGSRFAAARERWHAELSGARVHDLGLARLFFDASNRRPGWETTIRRNDWFQRRHLAWLRANEKVIAGGPPGVFFAYSYAARELLRFFKGIGWKTVLGQIDPGPTEEAIVAQEAKRFPESAGAWRPAPSDYWDAWREELALADRIVVNSEWSKVCLQGNGVHEAKMAVIPLAFEQSGVRAAARELPKSFTTERPLRVLFLGQVNLRKGAHHLLTAARQLEDLPVEFHFVGPVEVSRDEPPGANVHWHGPVSREATARSYALADVFALPTLSDGFALTQLEALSHGLPVIATENCGKVVEHDRNGWILPAPAAEGIGRLIRELVASPERVAACSARAAVPARFSMDSLRRNLVEFEESIG